MKIADNRKLPPAPIKGKFMEFKCHICKFESDDEDDFIYCDQCNHPVCEEHIRFIQHQGYEESICDNCHE